MGTLKREIYRPQVLEWTTDYSQECEELLNLIEECPHDVEELKRGYCDLTGEDYSDAFPSEPTYNELCIERNL